MPTVTETIFSDIYITPDKKAYIPNKYTENALMQFEPDDFDKLYNLFETSWDGINPSYSVVYDGIYYRVERTVTFDGIQYCARRMPSTVPEFITLNYPKALEKYLLNLKSASGLILWSGPTGSGKTTAISSLLKNYLTTNSNSVINKLKIIKLIIFQNIKVIKQAILENLK